MNTALFTRPRHPKIYAFTTPQGKFVDWAEKKPGAGLLKIGYTERNVIDRLREQFSSVSPEKQPFEILYTESAIREDNIVFRDSDVHKRLKSKGFRQIKNEWFECAVDDLKQVVSEIELPDEQQRREHIFQNMVYGIATSKLTGLLSRRTLYYSKDASSEYSVVKFDSDQGNVYFEHCTHTFGKDKKCIHCGKKESYGTNNDNYAYPFLHKPFKEIFNMDFDVIVGNPPYQLKSDGGTRDIPIYNRFVDYAKEITPEFMTMIIPSRWMSGGLGLKKFRNDMLSDKRIKDLVDHSLSAQIFPDVDIMGGVCYFLWDRDYSGSCSVTYSSSEQQYPKPVERILNEYDVFVRDHKSISILKKIQSSYGFCPMTEIMSVDKEFGWTSNFSQFHNKKQKNDVPLYYNRNGKRSIGFVNRKKVFKSFELIDNWKVMIPKARGHSGAGAQQVIGTPFITPSPSVCTQTYLFFYVDRQETAESILTYVKTKFFRYLVSLRKITQDATRSTYNWVPQQDWNTLYTDEQLYEKYNLNEKEIELIEKSVLSME